MSVFFSHLYSDFSGLQGKLTISTGPVIIHSLGDKILLHVSSTTGKYQFIGGRLDDTLSFRANALMRAREVIGENEIILSQDEPIVLLDIIVRDGKEEKILLIHYKASISDEVATGDAEWFTLDEIKEFNFLGQTSSPNIVICSEHFLVN